MRIKTIKFTMKLMFDAYINLKNDAYNNILNLCVVFRVKVNSIQELLCRKEESFRNFLCDKSSGF